MRTAALTDVRFELVPEQIQRRQHRRRGGVAKRAERLADDVVGDAVQEIDVLHLALSPLEALEQLVEPVAAFAARRALAARLVAVEVQQVHRQPDHADRVVHDDEPGRAEHRSGLLDVIEAGGRVEMLLEQDGNRGSSGDDAFELPAVQHALRVLVAKDQLTQRRVHRRFVHARPLDLTADAEQLGSAVLLRAQLGEPLRPIQDDERHVAERLDIVHRGRALIEARDRWKRRLDARLRALAFERFDERRFLAGFVRAGAAMHVDVAIEAAAQDVLAEIPGLVRRFDLPLEHLLHVVELAADVDVGDLRADGVAADRASLDDQMRVALHQHVILERPRLAFVGVTGDVLRLGRVLEDELPLESGRESCPAAAAQT